MEVIYVGNDNLLRVNNLKNQSDGSFVNDATVEATLLDAAGNEVAGQSWPSTLNYVANSDGTYEGVLEDGLTLEAGKVYTVNITADAGNDVIAEWNVPMRALKRG